MKCHLRRARISPRKASVVAGMIRNKKASEALDILKFTSNKPAQMLYKTLHSAISNAEHNGSKSRDNLVVKEVVINKGPSYKRYLPSTRGRALPLVKPTSHITIELAENA